MESTTLTKKKDSPAQEGVETVSTDMKRRPIKTFQQGGVHLALFSREHNGRKYFSWVITRSYRDKSGSYRYTNSLNVEDAPTVVGLAQQVIEYIRSLDYPEVEQISGK